MVQIVASHGLDNSPKGHLAAFGVKDRPVKLLFIKAGKQRQVPFAERSESCERICGRKLGIRGGPGILIERLNRMVRFSERLAQPKTKGNFAVRQMRNDLASYPFAGCEAAFKPVRTEP